MRLVLRIVLRDFLLETHVRVLAGQVIQRTLLLHGFGSGVRHAETLSPRSRQIVDLGALGEDALGRKHPPAGDVQIRVHLDHCVHAVQDDVHQVVLTIHKHDVAIALHLCVAHLLEEAVDHDVLLEIHLVKLLARDPIQVQVGDALMPKRVLPAVGGLSALPSAADTVDIVSVPFS